MCCRQSDSFLLFHLPPFSFDARRFSTRSFLALCLQLRCGESRGLWPFGFQPRGLQTLRVLASCLQLCRGDLLGSLPLSFPSCILEARRFLARSLLALRLQLFRRKSFGLLALGLNTRSLGASRFLTHTLLAFRLKLCCRETGRLLALRLQLFRRELFGPLALGLNSRSLGTGRFLTRALLTYRLKLCCRETGRLLALCRQLCGLLLHGEETSRLLTLRFQLRCRQHRCFLPFGFPPLSIDASRLPTRSFGTSCFLARNLLTLRLDLCRCRSFGVLAFGFPLHRQQTNRVLSLRLLFCGHSCGLPAFSLQSRGLDAHSFALASGPLFCGFSLCGLRLCSLHPVRPLGKLKRSLANVLADAVPRDRRGALRGCCTTEPAGTLRRFGRRRGA